MYVPSNRLCYICGAGSPETLDHIFPKGLFPKPIPCNLPRRLPACRECNEGLSKDEEVFRVFLTSGMAYENKSGFRIWEERIVPDLQGKRPGLKPYIKSFAKIIPAFSESGDLLGKMGVLEVERQPIQRIFYKIAKGLFFLDTNKVLPDDVHILVDYFTEPERTVSPPLDEAIKGAKKVTLGEGVVTYWRNIVKDDPTASVTWLQFYEDKVFLMCTFKQEIFEHVEEII